jgi:hypothetical protein
MVPSTSEPLAEPKSPPVQLTEPIVPLMLEPIAAYEFPEALPPYHVYAIPPISS